MATLTATARAKLLRLYPNYTSVLGPYLRAADGRKHVVLNNSNVPKGTAEKTKTISYPKALMEVKLGRRLTSDETVDHKDDDFTNDALSNLQILTRRGNILKGFKTGALSAAHLVEHSQSEQGRRNSSKRMHAYNQRRKKVGG